VKGVAVAAAFRATVSALLLYVADPALQPGLSLTGQGVGLYHQVMPRGDTGVPLQILTSAATEPDAGLASLVLIWLIPLSALIVGCPCHSLRSVQALGTFTSKSNSLARPYRASVSGFGVVVFGTWCQYVAICGCPPCRWCHGGPALVRLGGACCCIAPPSAETVRVVPPYQALSDRTQRPVAHLCVPDLTPLTLHCHAQGWQHISLGTAQ
jgi:hypothetical protein